MSSLFAYRIWTEREAMMQELKPLKSAAGSARVISMVVLAVILGGGYYALDRYTGGQLDASAVEGRGGAIIGALSRYKQETGSLPDTLDKLVPKHIAALGKCPNGQAYAYTQAGGDFSLACQDVLFKSKPYQYDSKARTWGG
jgi:type II secretory pathway pseudopilin PulG